MSMSPQRRNLPRPGEAPAQGSLVLARDGSTDRLWAVARWSALGAVPLLLLWLLLDPAPALTTLWYVVIPILPATFLLSTRLWRGVCPLATLNELGNRFGRQRPLGTRLTLGLAIGGLVLFHLMVPARHFLFNQNGPALVITVVAVGVLAVVSGSLFTVRSAFCNALCPVLPIEQLYGQSPLIRMNRGRCASCTLCVPTGCLDLTDKVIPHLLGPARRSAGWLGTPHGVFFAALPGFIIGYNLAKDVGPTEAAMVYGLTLGWSAVSYLAIAAAVLAFRIPSRIALLVTAALAAGIYYWYAGPAIASHLGTGGWVGLAVRFGGIGLVMVWAARTLSRAG